MYDKYEALIFDMDGTLIDSGRLHEHAWTHALTHFDIPISRSSMRAMAGVPTRQTIEKLFEELGRQDHSIIANIAETKERFVHAHKHDYLRPTSLLDTVRAYHGERPMAVGTGANRDEAINMLSMLDLLDFFDTIVTADDVANHKPAPDTFLKAAEQLKVDAAHCVVFEDSPLGLEAARRAGMHAVDVLGEFGIRNPYFD